MDTATPPPPRLTRGRWPCWLLILLWALGPVAVDAQSLDLHLPARVSDPRTPQVMRDLAERIIPVFRDTDRQSYLENLSALQAVAGSSAAAYAARLSLRDLRSRTPSAFATEGLVSDLDARARALEAEEKTPYAEGFARSFEAAVAPLDDLSAYRLIRELKIPPAVFQDALQQDFDHRQGQERIDMQDALALIRSYLAFDAHRRFAAVIPAIAAADDQRRYLIDSRVLIPQAGGTSLPAMLVRPRSAAGRVTTLLTVSIDIASGNDALECAAHGYVGVVASVRGNRVTPRGRVARGEPASPEQVVPYEHEGEDAHDIMGWIVAQDWSDGRVGMYGSGYSGFAAWAATRQAPAALKAIAVTSTTMPGIDLPMEGSIFRNLAYRWLLSFTRGQNEEIDQDDARWRALDERWYLSGSPYRDLDRLFGVPSPIFQRWLNHPSYDAYWQRMMPQARELAHLSIPVFATTGYYDPAAVSVLENFARHHRSNPRADHTLLIGPYDSRALGSRPSGGVGGYTLDPAAILDLHELRYQWFDHELRGGSRPAVLAGAVNYEVMGADTWRHVSSLEPASKALRLYLTPGAGGGLLSSQPGKPGTFMRQTVNLAERSAAGWPTDERLLSASVGPSDRSTIYVSEPLSAAVELGGRPAVELDLTINKRDVDLTAALYEQLADGQYLKLYDPPYEQRASYARDRRVRRLLRAGELERLTLHGARWLARRVQAGSRLVLVLGVKKRPDEEINYGSGRDVSEESRADAGRPLEVRWYGSSHLDLPVWP
jgi:putative CocE/NonD family hydrolase